MQLSSITNRMQGLGGAKWELQIKGRQMANAGMDVIELTLGEPDVAFPDDLVESAVAALRRGRTRYAEAQGEPELLDALADHYSKRSERTFTPENFLCFPGTQTALFAAILALAEAGDEILIGDPMYATYEGVVRASGASVRPVPLRPEFGFCMQGPDLESCVTSRSRAVLLTTPHNPTGSVLSREDLGAIADVALKHDLWIVSDEVYADLIFDTTAFSSPLDIERIKDRVIVVSSISKSHAATGLRSGWCVGPADFIEAILPLTEAMLFGNQPFIADVTTDALRNGSTVIDGMRNRYAARAHRLDAVLGGGRTCLQVYRPRAGMFALLDVSATGMSGREFALALLADTGVAVMPGCSFGDSLEGFVRTTLTASDDAFDTALERIAGFCAMLAPGLRGTAAE